MQAASSMNCPTCKFECRSLPARKNSCLSNAPNSPTRRPWPGGRGRGSRGSGRRLRGVDPLSLFVADPSLEVSPVSGVDYRLHIGDHAEEVAHAEDQRRVSHTHHGGPITARELEPAAAEYRAFDGFHRFSAGQHLTNHRVECRGQPPQRPGLQCFANLGNLGTERRAWVSTTPRFWVWLLPLRGRAFRAISIIHHW